jgi:predicted NUDIX family NTP pyrophosphohydrolase
MILSKKYEGSKVICEYNSSNLKLASYDSQTKKLKVTFGSGQVYEYDEVPHEIFAALNLSESQGKYFNQNISKVYKYKKL